MKKLILIAALSWIFNVYASAQQLEKLITFKEVERIEKILSADDMQGRKPGMPGIEMAAGFIESEFRKAGLQFSPGMNTYRQKFNTIRAKFIAAAGTFNEHALIQDNIICITTEASLKVNTNSGYRIIKTDTSNLIKQAKDIMKGESNCIVLVSNFHAANFSKLKFLKRDVFGMRYSVLFLLTDETSLNSYDFDISHQITTTPLCNVVGWIPGSTKKDEFVIFSGHYDHLGIGKANADQDSIYNGANDDAAGTTAVIMLANYFNQIKNNERTLIFVAFTSEESGGYGSRYFSQQLDADKAIAMFNIEMIGTESKWGTNSCYITGYEKSDFGQILQANLSGSNFHFEPDPYPQQNLFYRSDNATLAALGVPAHTISTSKMDAEKYYHSVDDEIETLDIKNMVEIIKAIAISSQSIVHGKDTPKRIEKLN